MGDGEGERRNEQRGGVDLAKLFGKAEGEGKREERQRLEYWYIFKK
jgi:hypothetical protein